MKAGRLSAAEREVVILTVKLLSATSRNEALMAELERVIGELEDLKRILAQRIAYVVASSDEDDGPRLLN